MENKLKTYHVKGDYTDRKWFVVDAEEQVLGRLCSKIASILIGKHKPIFSRHLDVGDYIVVINAEKIRVTGNKEEQKMYYSHSGYTGHLKSTSYRHMQEKNPEFIIHNAVRKMLPKSILGRNMIKKLKIYAGPEHQHDAQKPVALTLDNLLHISEQAK